MPAFPPTNSVKIDTILLDGTNPDFPPTTTSENETKFGHAVTTWPAPSALLNIPANSLVAYTVTFKSGIVPVIGTDTAVLLYQKDPATDPLPEGTRRANYFGTLINENTSKKTGTPWSNPTFYNNSQLQPNNNAYGQGNWKGTYIPGSAFTSADLFTDCRFYLTATLISNAGLNDIKNDQFALGDIYPNPASGTDKPAIAFTLKQNAVVNVTILNMLGQEVKTLLNKKYDSGSQTEYLDINGLKPGMYLVNMTVNGSSISKKLSITE